MSTPALPSMIPTSGPPPQTTLTADDIAFIMSKGPEYFDLLSHQSPSQLSFYRSLTPWQFNFHITVHKRALASMKTTSNVDAFKALYTVRSLATRVILQVFPPDNYPEHSPDTPAVALLKELIWEKSQYYINTYGVDGVIQKLTAGEVLEYGRIPDCSTQLSEVCLHFTKVSIDRMGELGFEHQSQAGGLLWQMIAEKVNGVLEEEKKIFEEEWSTKYGKDIEEVRGLVGPTLYDSVGMSRAMKWRDFCSSAPDTS